MKRLLALGLLLVCGLAYGLTLTTVNPDGSSVTYTVGDSFAYQAFKGAINPIYINNEGAASSVQVVSIADKAGNVFTLGPNGEVYRNALRLATVSSLSGAVQKMLAQRLVLVGTEVFALGKTDGKWWRWVGNATTNAWASVTDFDPVLLLATGPIMPMPLPVPDPPIVPTAP
jgi:hypothetical protein